MVLAGALVLLCAGCTTLPAPFARKPPPDPRTEMPALETRIFQLVQQARAKLDPGAPPLVLDPELAGIATKRSEDMAKRNSFTPADGDRHASATMLMDEDAKFQGLLGENVAAQHYTKAAGIDVNAFAKRFVKTWLDSKPHKENLSFADYSRTGVGAAVNGDTVYVTQLFATDLGLGPRANNAPPREITSEPTPEAGKEASRKPDLRLRGAIGERAAAER